MQSLALDIAGRSMFSLETRHYGAAMRSMLTEYAGYARPTLLDILLPASIMAPRDLGRRRFHRRWMALIDSIMQTPAWPRRPPRPRATCSTCCAPRAIPRPAPRSVTTNCATRSPR
jgi:hypothetical protein